MHAACCLQRLFTAPALFIFVGSNVTILAFTDTYQQNPQEQDTGKQFCVSFTKLTQNQTADTSAEMSGPIYSEFRSQQPQHF